jgi:Ca-activated chloride channel family protein
MRLQVLLCLLVFLLVALPAGRYISACMPAVDIQNLVAQSLPQTGQPIRISTNLIQVPVSVTDAEGHAIKDLQKDDFNVEENGARVTIAQMGEPGETRLEMVLVFDISGSVFARFDFEQQAATSFLQKIFRPRDAVAILSIGPVPRVVLDRTTSLATAMEGLGQLRPSAAATSFYDSIIAAAGLLKIPADPDTRRVQIVLSDGEDNRSDQQLADALREVQQADCIFYSINPGGQSIHLNKGSMRGQQGMETLAAETGGTAFLADKLQDLAQIYGRIAAELQAQYLLSYYSPDPKTDGSFRRIAVRVPRRPELRLRARLGYYATRAPNR